MSTAPRLFLAIILYLINIFKYNKYDACNDENIQINFQIPKIIH